MWGNTPFEDVVAFLGSGAVIVTNSYHGAYWATLLGRPTVLWNPWCSEILLLKYPLPWVGPVELGSLRRGRRRPRVPGRSHRVPCCQPGIRSRRLRPAHRRVTDLALSVLRVVRSPFMAIIGTHALLYTSEPEAVRDIFRDVFGWKHVDAGHGWLIFRCPPLSSACTRARGRRSTRECAISCR